MTSPITLTEEEKKLWDVVLEPYTYAAANGGKQVRTLLVDAFDIWLKLPTKAMIDSIKEIAETLHAASLVMDDIEDKTLVRRGKPAAHIVYGEPLAMNAACFSYFIAIQKLKVMKEEHRKLEMASEDDYIEPDVTDLALVEMQNLHFGQGLDILWREKCQCPTIEQYRTMIRHKTGGLFRLMVGCMQAMSSNKDPAVMELADSLGIFYQIRDDYINLTSDEYFRTRGTFGDDITEGKFSFPIVHWICTHPEDKTILEILKLRTSDPAIKTKAIELMRDGGSLDFTKNALREELEKIDSLIWKLGGNMILEKLISTLRKDCA